MHPIKARVKAVGSRHRKCLPLSEDDFDCGDVLQDIEDIITFLFTINVCLDMKRNVFPFLALVTDIHLKLYVIKFD